MRGQYRGGGAIANPEKCLICSAPMTEDGTTCTKCGVEAELAGIIAKYARAPEGLAKRNIGQ